MFVLRIPVITRQYKAGVFKSKTSNPCNNGPRQISKIVSRSCAIIEYTLEDFPVFKDFRRDGTNIEIVNHEDLENIITG